MIHTLLSTATLCFTKGNKNVSISQIEVLKGPMGAQIYLLWHIVLLNCRSCLVWPCVASYGLVAFYGNRHVWPCAALCGLVWPLVWPCMDYYGRILSFLAVIDPNLFGLVQNWLTFFTQIGRSLPIITQKFKKFMISSTKSNSAEKNMAWKSKLPFIHKRFKITIK